MAIPDVSATYKDTIRSLLESLEYLMRPYSGGTQRSDGPHIGRILKPAYPSQVCPGVSAPVAQKTNNFRLKLTIGHF
jgi:hypothetical protein